MLLDFSRFTRSIVVNVDRRCGILGSGTGMPEKGSLFPAFLMVSIWISASDAHAGFSSLYVFGDSLSDSGNNAVVFEPKVTPVPIPGNSFIATFPYASGRYTNAEVWAQILASSLGL